MCFGFGTIQSEWYTSFTHCSTAFPYSYHVVLVVKNPPAKARDVRDWGSIPRMGRSLGEGHGNSFQYSCLENPTDRGVWQPTLHGVKEPDSAEATWHPHTHHVSKLCLSLLQKLQSKNKLRWEDGSTWENMMSLNSLLLRDPSNYNFR